MKAGCRSGGRPLNLKANPLIEQEVTKLVQMLGRQTAVTGIEHAVVDNEARDMAQNAAIGHLTEELDRWLR